MHMHVVVTEKYLLDSAAYQPQYGYLLLQMCVSRVAATKKKKHNNQPVHGNLNRLWHCGAHQRGLYVM